MKKLFFLLAFLSFALISCEKEPILTLSVEEIIMPSSGGGTTITVNSNSPWTATNTDWCTVSPLSSEGGEVQVTIFAKQNTTYDSRNCSIVFCSKDLTSTVNVAQESNYGMLLSNSVYEVSSKAQQVSVEVKANINYEVTINDNWITQSDTKALSSKTFIFDIAENNGYNR